MYVIRRSTVDSLIRPIDRQHIRVVTATSDDVNVMLGTQAQVAVDSMPDGGMLHG